MPRLLEKRKRRDIAARPYKPTPSVAAGSRERTSSGRPFSFRFELKGLSAQRVAMAAAPAPMPAAVAGWWERVNGSPAWQDGIFCSLAVLYGIVAVASIVSVSSPPHVNVATAKGNMLLC